jgi:hypothetical protein
MYAVSLPTSCTILFIFLYEALKGPIHSKLNCAVWLYKKLHEKMNWMFSGTAQVSHQVCQFLCHLLSVPRDDAIMVLAGELGKLWDSLSELRGSLCERQPERTVLRPGLLPVKSAQFTQFFHQVWHHMVKSLSLTENVYGTLHVSAIYSGYPQGVTSLFYVYSIYGNLSNYLWQVAIDAVRIKPNCNSMKMIWIYGWNMQNFCIINKKNHCATSW